MDTIIRLLVAAVNSLLTLEGADYRVSGEVIRTRRDGYTILALRETTNAADYRGGVNPPIVNMAGQ